MSRLVVFMLCLFARRCQPTTTYRYSAFSLAIGRRNSQQIRRSSLPLGEMRNLSSQSENVRLVWEQTEKADPQYRTIHLQKVAGMPQRGHKYSETKDCFSLSEFERQKQNARNSKKLGIRPNFLDVIYEDEYIVVVNKPPGVLTVPGKDDPNGCLADLVHERYSTSQDGTVTEKEHMIAHRLDMDTSGLIVFGRNRAVTQQLHAQFRDRSVIKEYRAVVVGHFPIDQCRHGIIDLPLQKDVFHPPYMRVSTPQYEALAYRARKDIESAGWRNFDKSSPRPSQTHFHVGSVGTTPVHNLPLTHISLIPATGRTHQLRVHCAAIGFPIVGDATYSIFGDAAPGGGLADLEHVLGLPNPMNNHHSFQASLEMQQKWIQLYQPNAKPMCLHAAKLTFTHPTRPTDRLTFEVEPNFDAYLNDI